MLKQILESEIVNEARATNGIEVFRNGDDYMKNAPCMKIKAKNGVVSFYKEGKMDHKYLIVSENAGSEKELVTWGYVENEDNNTFEYESDDIDDIKKSAIKQFNIDLDIELFNFI